MSLTSQHLCRGAGIAAALLALSLIGACSNSKPGDLSAGSQAPTLPRVSDAKFTPKIGDTVTIEIFLVRPDAMNQAAEVAKSQTLPVVREHCLSEVWLVRNDTLSQLLIISAWKDPVDIQRWQFSKQRHDAYQPLGPFLTAQPQVQAGPMIGEVKR